jgi:hypothetical protein
MGGLLGGMISGVIPMLLLLVFIGGYAWAGKFCKSRVSQFFVGIMLGFGILFVLAGVAFAGCCLVLSRGNF